MTECRRAVDLPRYPGWRVQILRAKRSATVMFPVARARRSKGGSRSALAFCTSHRYTGVLTCTARFESLVSTGSPPTYNQRAAGEVRAVHGQAGAARVWRLPAQLLLILAGAKGGNDLEVFFCRREFARRRVLEAGGHGSAIAAASICLYAA